MTRYRSLLLLLLAVLVNVPYSFAGSYSRVIVEFEPVTDIDANLAELRMLGYDFQVIDELHNVMHGAVINIASDQVERLGEEKMVSNIYGEKFLRPNLEKSIKLINAADVASMRDSLGRALTGEGVRVAVVDTGVDYTHPDLLGLGDGKVVGGYDFLEDDGEPMDADGHGTLVAGIIAADGLFRGVAPEAELLAYRVASENTYVSSIEMIRALERATNDDVDIVNISLGLDTVSEEIDRAVENLVRQGVVVVTAAGNNGEEGNIGSPASTHGAISVGASLNNVTSGRGFLMTMRIDGDSVHHELIPMLDSPPTREISGKLVFASFATQRDVQDADLAGAIVLAERGGPVISTNGDMEMELVYFAEKEHNAASNGAAALIVYNNMPGTFYGKLIHDDVQPGYEPSIPVMSVSRDEGLRIKHMIASGHTGAEIRINEEPDMVAPFSSRGPVSPFYMKPDLLAPGAFVNSTTIGNSYEMVSGTSFAAPHVTGAAALLLQKHPELTPAEVASILATTADPLLDPYGVPYDFDATGTGRLDVAAALESNLIAVPHYAVIHLSPLDSTASRVVNLRAIDGELGELRTVPEWMYGGIMLDASVERTNNTAILTIGASLVDDVQGRFEGKVRIETGSNTIYIPVIVHAESVGVNASNDDGRIGVSIDIAQPWKFAKVKITSAGDGSERIVSLTPSRNTASVLALNAGEHWIEADVTGDGGNTRGFSVLYVSDVSPVAEQTTLYGIPFKEALVIASFLGIASVIAMIWTKSGGPEKRTVQSF